MSQPASAPGPILLPEGYNVRIHYGQLVNFNAMAMYQDGLVGERLRLEERCR
ncbi:MAG: hypothetical protein R2867_37890 [Caldilineaceae bacterium]